MSNPIQEDEELYEVYAGNGLHRIAQGVSRDKATKIARDFELRCARQNVDVPASRIVKLQAQLTNKNTEGSNE